MAMSANNHRSSFARSLSSIHLKHVYDVAGSDINAALKEKRVCSSISPTDIKSAKSPISCRCDGHWQSAAPFSKDGRPSRKSDRKFQRRSSTSAMSENNSKKVEVNKQRRRRATVTFAPSGLDQQELVGIRYKRDGNHCTVAQEEDQQEHKGYSQDYRLGDTIRSTSHMIIEPTLEKATSAVNTLQKHDFAFVKRSSGSYSYAILAFRVHDPMKGECMTFVMNDIGATKCISQKHWSKNVHLVSVDSRGLEPSIPPTVASNIPQGELPAVPSQGIPVLCEPCDDIESNMNDDFIPPRMISFVSKVDHVEEFSVISSVSDRARMQDAG